jgi:hypothetical protein
MKARVCDCDYEIGCETVVLTSRLVLASDLPPDACYAVCYFRIRAMHAGERCRELLGFWLPRRRSCEPRLLFLAHNALPQMADGAIKRQSQDPPRRTEIFKAWKTIWLQSINHPNRQCTKILNIHVSVIYQINQVECLYVNDHIHIAYIFFDRGIHQEPRCGLN